VSNSPELAQALKRQLIAIEAIRRLDTPAPNELHERIQRAKQLEPSNETGVATEIPATGAPMVQGRFCR
jgi:hypothetical protein